MYDKVGRLRKHFDTAGRLTERVHDDANRTVTTINAELEATTVRYNLRGQVHEVRDALNQTYTFEHDALGRLLSRTRAGWTTSYQYDEAGNVVKRTDDMGRVTDYTYDDLDRLTKIVYDNGAGNPTPKLQSTYAYDEISRLVSAANEQGTVSFSYDSRDRLASATDVHGRVLAYEYELSPTVNRTRTKLDGGLYATYNFDDAGRLTSIVDAADSSAVSFGYDAEGKLTSRTYPNGIATSYEYFGDDLLKRLADAGPGGPISDRHYSYDAAGRIASVAEPNRFRSFAYDDVGRLTGVTDSLLGAESYAYDAVGNRTASHRSAAHAYSPFNRLASTATAAYGFNAQGETVWRAEGSQRWTFAHDREGRLTRAADRKRAVRHAYDALGRRVRTSGPDGTVKHTYDGADVILDERDGDLTRYQNGPGIDNKLSARSGTSVSYFLADHLGSTTALADGTGAVTSQAVYDAFGNPSGNLATRYGFTGRERDDLTGLYYYRARMYDPKLGRFTSEDPIGFAGGDVNLYGYVGNDPLSFVDPTGQSVGIPLPYQFPRFTGSEAADWLQARIGVAADFYGFDPPVVYNVFEPLRPRGLFASMSSACDMLRIGSDIDRAFAPDENIYGRAAFVAIETERFAALFGTMAGGAAGRFGRFGRTPSNPAVEWLGEGSRTITNKAGDKVFLSADGNRRIRFDFNRPYPHQNPHMHVEEMINGEWRGSGQIYPQGVDPW